MANTTGWRNDISLAKADIAAMKADIAQGVRNSWLNLPAMLSPACRGSKTPSGGPGELVAMAKANPGNFYEKAWQSI